jgi:hypothetical protein
VADRLHPAAADYIMPLAAAGRFAAAARPRQAGCILLIIPVRGSI